MIWACPLGKELEESALIGSWQFLSRHLNASWTCENSDLYWFLWNIIYSAQAHSSKHVFTENTSLFWAECMSKVILQCNTFVRNKRFSTETRLKKKYSSCFLAVESKYILPNSHTYHNRDSKTTLGTERNIFINSLKVYRELFFECKPNFVSFLYVTQMYSKTVIKSKY